MGDLAPSLVAADRKKQLLIIAGDVETNPGPGMNLSISKVCTSAYQYIVDGCTAYIVDVTKFMTHANIYLYKLHHQCD